MQETSLDFPTHFEPEECRLSQVVLSQWAPTPPRRYRKVLRNQTRRSIRSAIVRGLLRCIPAWAAAAVFGCKISLVLEYVKDQQLPSRGKFFDHDFVGVEEAKYVHSELGKRRRGGLQI